MDQEMRSRVMSRINKGKLLTYTEARALVNSMSLQQMRFALEMLLEGYETKKALDVALS